MSTIGRDLAARRSADRGADRLQQQPRRRRAGVALRRGGLRARGPVHRRARAIPDRHGRLRRLRAAGDDAARAHGRAQDRTATSICSRTTRRSTPLGEALPNSEIFRRLAAKMGFDEPCFRESDDEIAAAAFTEPNFDWETLKRSGWQRLDRPKIYAPFANGGFPTKSGKCEIYSEQLATLGLDPVPGYVAAARGRRYGARGTLSARDDLAAGAQLHELDVRQRAELARRRRRAASRDPSARCGGARHRGRRARARVQRPRLARAQGARHREARGPASSSRCPIWWKKLARDGKNANELTSQVLTDIGRAPTFYDCRVEIEPASLEQWTASRVARRPFRFDFSRTAPRPRQRPAGRGCYRTRPRSFPGPSSGSGRAPCARR